jgi:hypothetical protein
MAITGMIGARTQGLIPITWDALMKDSRYGEDFLQVAIDTAKEDVTGEVVDPSIEDTEYGFLVRDFIAKKAVLLIIPAGIDFWMNQTIAETAEGTHEVTSFTDRAEQLRELYKLLLDEIKGMEDEIAEIIGFQRTSTVGLPSINTLEDEFLTPSHQEFPRPFRATQRS